MGEHPRVPLGPVGTTYKQFSKKTIKLGLLVLEQWPSSSYLAPKVLGLYAVEKRFQSTYAQESVGYSIV